MAKGIFVHSYFNMGYCFDVENRSHLFGVIHKPISTVIVVGFSSILGQTYFKQTIEVRGNWINLGLFHLTKPALRVYSLTNSHISILFEILLWNHPNGYTCTQSCLWLWNCGFCWCLGSNWDWVLFVRKCRWFRIESDFSYYPMSLVFTSKIC